jgi:pimeloyl-ACP methyl ester carboxylesterase
MLEIDKTGITELEAVYRLESGTEIFAKTLKRDNNCGRTAIFIHGGGSGGNHTIVCRPSYWLMNRGLFSSVIMPDRRGAGKSSPITSVMSYEENAKDMKELLDSMGVTGDITAIGVSYGGPIALTLAAIDKRVKEVCLVASSPSLMPARGLVRILYKTGMLEKLAGSVYQKLIGTEESAYPDFDGAYLSKNEGDLKKIFLSAVRRTDKGRLDSLLLENASTCDVKNAAIDERFSIEVPVFRVIGTRDETWERELGTKYENRIPELVTSYIDGASHKDVFFRAPEFYKALEGLLNAGSELTITKPAAG